jgi:hypothetical protein
MRWVAATCAIGTAACAWEDSMQRSLQPYEGKNVKVLIGRIGYPDSQDALLGKHVYVWNLRNADEAMCKITVATDARDTVQDFSFLGDRRACGIYADKLDE